MSVRNIFADESHDIYTVRTHADGPDGELPLTAEMLINRPSGDLFGMTMNAGMGWSPDELDRDGILLLSTLAVSYTHLDVYKRQRQPLAP